MSDLKRIAVLMGGVSPEHDVSLSSGSMVLSSLDPAKYTGLGVTVGKDGRWAVGDADPVPAIEAVSALHAAKIDCVFIALHGAFGEDGRVQGMLDILGLPYTGSGCAASALAMDKVRCKAVVSSQGIRVANHIALDRDTWQLDPDAVIEAVRKDLGFPCVVKTSCGGSSLGTTVPGDEAAFRTAMVEVLKHGDSVLVERFVAGREVTCGVLDAEPGGMIRPLPVTEIIPKNKGGFWTYESKYTAGATDEITPADLTPAMTSQIMEMAAHVHEIVGCRGWSRSDFIIDGQGPVWLEVNTVPGLTPTSLYPQAAAAAGINYRDMISLFIERALRDAASREQHA